MAKISMTVNGRQMSGEAEGRIRAVAGAEGDTHA